MRVAPIGVRRDGLHHRQVRDRRDPEPDRWIAPSTSPPRCSCSWCSASSRGYGFFDLSSWSTSRTRAPDRARYVIVESAAFPDGSRRPAAPSRSSVQWSRPPLVQPRRHQYLLRRSHLFIAQALGFDLTFGQQLTIPLVAMLFRRGRPQITGAGFITLAATLAVAIRVGAGVAIARHRQVHERARAPICAAMASPAWWSPRGRRARSRQAARQSQQGDRSTDVETAVTTD